jgi:hypothetical protein
VPPGDRPVVGRQTDGEMMESSLCGEARPDQQDVMVGVHGGDHLGRGRVARAMAVRALADDDLSDSARPAPGPEPGGSDSLGGIEVREAQE